ncbi:MAG: hypothetical protein ACOX0U_10615 [Oscillospiraceae bacterium]|jgi:hypothetical protein
MRKLVPLLLVFVMLAGCSGKAPNDIIPSDVAMPEIIDLLCKDVDVPAYEATELTGDNFEYFAFIPYTDGLTGYQADALINSIPHSLVLVRSENGNTADIAQKMLDNADIRKWICVSADVKQVAYTERYVLLVMSSAEVVEGLIANFETAVNDGEVTMLDAVGADALSSDGIPALD